MVLQCDGKLLVFAGNLRTTAAKALKWQVIDAVLYIPENDEDKETIKRRSILDNGAFGSWDYDMLANEWDDLPLSDWGVPAWDTENLESVSAPKEVEEDDFDESKDHIEVRCKKGDVWQLGDHRLMCGDSVSLDDVKKLMGGAEADMIFTDPPYNVAIGDKNKALNAMAPCERIERNLEGDTFGSDEECGQKLWKPAFSAMRCVAKDKCAIYVTMPQGGTHMMMMMMMMHEAGWQVKHELIWLKNSPTFSMGRLDYDYQHEPICFGWNKGHKKIGGGQYTKSVWTIDKPKKCDLHPTMKPIELVANAIQNSSEEGDVILDAFGGSGTTLIASEQTGRKAYLMEYDEQYCDVIIARWEKFTGKTATKIN
jgi:site-specific DNA-methyltransferase (adenine-specific)